MNKILFNGHSVTSLLTVGCMVAGAACTPVDSQTGSGGAGGASTSASTTTSASASTGEGTSGTGGTTPMPQAALTLLGEASKTIDPGSSYKPINIDGIPPFSSAVLRIGVRNDDTKPITIKDVTVVAKDGTLADEWAISKPGSTKREPFDLNDVALEPGASTEFGLHFWAFASGPRPATVTVHTTTGESTSFIVDGRGRDNLELSTKVSATLEKVLAAPSADFNVGGIVGDGKGGAVYSANAVQLLDQFGRDVVVARVAADGSQSWAKVWNETYIQESPAPDQNNETGGGADSIDFAEGFTYVAASRAVDKSNSIPASFQALVVKVDAASGAVAWARGFRNSTFATPNDGDNQAWRGAMGYAVDASLADRVLTTGYTGQPPRMLLVALKKTDGSQIYAHAIDLGNDGLADRGFTVHTDASGNGWLGGDSNGRAVLVRLTGLDGAQPSLEGSYDLGAGIGSRINSIALAPDGAAIVSLYTGGADRAFVVARVKTDGSLSWSKTWSSGSFGANDNTHVVRLQGGTVYAGGNIAVEAADTTHGDGFMLGLDAATGAYELGALYYTGKNTEYIAKHMVKGFVFGGADVFALTQGTTVQGNVDHYWGYWYQAPDDTLVLPAGDGSKRLVDYPLAPKAVSSSTIDSLAPGVVGPNGINGGTAHAIDTTPIWKDLPATATWTAAKGYSGETSQTHPLVSKLNITP